MYLRVYSAVILGFVTALLTSLLFHWNHIQEQAHHRQRGQVSACCASVPRHAAAVRHGESYVAPPPRRSLPHRSTMPGDTRLVDVQRATIERLLGAWPWYAQASFLPVDRGGSAATLVTGIQPGSVYELIGLRDGDRVMGPLEDLFSFSAYPPRPWSSAARPAMPDFLDLDFERAGARVRIIVLLHDGAVTPAS